MRMDLINELIDSYEGSNLQEDTKLAVAQAVVNRSKDRHEAYSILGIPQTTLDSWFRKGWLIKPKHFSARDGRFKKGHKLSEEGERKRRSGLKKTFVSRGYKINKLADA